MIHRYLIFPRVAMLDYALFLAMILDPEGGEHTFDTALYDQTSGAEKYRGSSVRIGQYWHAAIQAIRTDNANLPPEIAAAIEQRNAAMPDAEPLTEAQLTAFIRDVHLVHFDDDAPAPPGLSWQEQIEKLGCELARGEVSA